MADAKERGMAIYRRAKEAAMEKAALDAYNAHFFKCTPSCSVAEWTTAWKKAVAWWTEPVNAPGSNRVDPTACPECIGMGCVACHNTGNAAPSDTDLLNFQAMRRVEVTPEFEGPWDAKVYIEGDQPEAIFTGNTPREALAKAAAAYGVPVVSAPGVDPRKPASPEETARILGVPPCDGGRDA